VCLSNSSRNLSVLLRARRASVASLMGGVYEVQPQPISELINRQSNFINIGDRLVIGDKSKRNKLTLMRTVSTCV